MWSWGPFGRLALWRGLKFAEGSEMYRLPGEAGCSCLYDVKAQPRIWKIARFVPHLIILASKNSPADGSMKDPWSLCQQSSWEAPIRTREVLKASFDSPTPSCNLPLPSFFVGECKWRDRTSSNRDENVWIESVWSLTCHCALIKELLHKKDSERLMTTLLQPWFFF